MPEKKKH